MPSRPDWRAIYGGATPAPESGARSTDERPTIDGRYKVVEQLGAGAMGVVYRAEDIWLGRMVALKVIEPRQSADAGAVERFKKEARTLAQVSHENIVQVYTFGPHGSSFYLAMEYIAGRGLDAVIEEHAARSAG